MPTATHTGCSDVQASMATSAEKRAWTTVLLAMRHASETALALEAALAREVGPVAGSGVQNSESIQKSESSEFGRCSEF